MNDAQEPVNKELFIPAVNRPQSRPNLDKYPPLAPDASEEEVAKRARDVLEDWHRQGLMASTDSQASPDIWRQVLSRNPGVVWTDMDDQAVLVNLDTTVCYTLNRVGTEFWNLCDCGRTVESVTQTIGEGFDVDEEILRDDIRALVTVLTEEGLLVQERRS